jgi:hypothetical protein
MSEFKSNKAGHITNGKGEKVGEIWDEGGRKWWSQISGCNPEGPFRTRRIALDRTIHRLKERIAQINSVKNAVIRKAPYKLTNHPDSLDREVIEKLRSRGGTWAIYENHEKSSLDHGRLVCLKYGSDCTFPAPPEKAPDSSEWGSGWMYCHVGFFDHETGLIHPTLPDKKEEQQV